MHRAAVMCQARCRPQLTGHTATERKASLPTIQREWVPGVEVVSCPQWSNQDSTAGLCPAGHWVGLRPTRVCSSAWFHRRKPLLPLIISLVPRVSPEPRGLLGPVSPKAKEKEGWTVLGFLSPHTT